MNHELHKLKMKGSFDDNYDADACDDPPKGKHNKAIKMISAQHSSNIDKN